MLSFTDESPRVEGTFKLNKLQTWETLSDSAAVTMGTGVYTTSIKLSAQQAKLHWQIDLGDVRESARVYINNQSIREDYKFSENLYKGDLLKLSCGKKKTVILESNS